MIRSDILQQFPGLFGKKTVNGRELDVDETITLLSREIDPAITEALAARRAILAAPGAVAGKYAWPAWDESFEDPISGKSWTYRQIVQGLVDNFLGKESPLRWRLPSCKTLSRLDLPTPDWPTSALVSPARCSFRSAMPSPVTTEHRCTSQLRSW